MNIQQTYNEYKPGVNSYLLWLLDRVSCLRNDPKKSTLRLKMETALVGVLGLIDTLRIAKMELQEDMAMLGDCTTGLAYDPQAELAEIETYLNFYLGE